MITLKSVFRSKPLHIIPEEAPEDEDEEEAQPANSGEDSDEFSDDVEDLLEPQKQPKPQCVWFLCPILKRTSSFNFSIYIFRETVKPEQKPKGTVRS